MRIGVGLSIPELATRGGRAFSPLSLFTSGVQGAWYAPDDYSTLFQDSAGTTPVTAVEQPVGLMLDKSQGLVLGSELVTNGDFSGGTTGWTANNATIVVESGRLKVTVTTVADSRARQTISGLTAGRFYLVTGTFEPSISCRVRANGVVANTVYSQSTANASFTLYFPATSSTATIDLELASSASWMAIGQYAFFDNISVKELAGNHASQATTASRPVLRARYNQATYSEQIDNAAWTKSGIVTTGSWTNVLTAPDGTLTADLFRPTNTSTNHYAIINSSLPSAAGTYTCSLYVYAGGYTKFALRESASTGAYVSFNIATATVIDSASAGTVTISSSSITAVAGYPGWYRAVVTYVYSAGVTPNLGFWALPDSYTTGQPSSTSWAGDATSGIYIWGAQVVTGSSAGTYQRIAASTDYATAGFLPYLAFSTDDSFGTGSIDFTATDKMFVCAGVTKLSDANSAMVAELSANAVLNAGAFNLQAPATGATAEYRYLAGGTTSRSATATTYAAPITNVVTGLNDIVGDVLRIRVNGTQIAESLLDQGTGNFGNYALFIGRRNNSNLPFEGRIYGLIVAGKTLSASELASTESWMNSKTGAY